MFEKRILLEADRRERHLAECMAKQGFALAKQKRRPSTWSGAIIQDSTKIWIHV